MWINRGCKTFFVRLYNRGKQERTFMARKKFFIVIDTETTQTNKVADFGAVICDKQGEIHAQCGVLVREFYLDREKHPLFHCSDGDALWGKSNLPKRYAAYDAMLQDGRRMLASVAAINRWLAQAAAKYQPIATAYNIAFDKDKCEKSGIDLQMFSQSFCLWHAAVEKWAFTRNYRQFVLDNHMFNPPTGHGNMSFQAKADGMAKFILGPGTPDEPHTALEDARDYEVPILAALVRNTSPKDYMNPEPSNWRAMQVRDWFRPI